MADLKISNVRLIPYGTGFRVYWKYENARSSQVLVYYQQSSNKGASWTNDSMAGNTLDAAGYSGGVAVTSGTSGYSIRVRVAYKKTDADTAYTYTDYSNIVTKSSYYAPYSVSPYSGIGNIVTVKAYEGPMALPIQCSMGIVEDFSTLGTITLSVYSYWPTNVRTAYLYCCYMDKVGNYSTGANGGPGMFMINSCSVNSTNAVTETRNLTFGLGSYSVPVGSTIAFGVALVYSDGSASNITPLNFFLQIGGGNTIWQDTRRRNIAVPHVCTYSNSAYSFKPAKAHIYNGSSWELCGGYPPNNLFHPDSLYAPGFVTNKTAIYLPALGLEEGKTYYITDAGKYAVCYSNGFTAFSKDGGSTTGSTSSDTGKMIHSSASATTQRTFKYSKDFPWLYISSSFGGTNTPSYYITAKPRIYPS